MVKMRKRKCFGDDESGSCQKIKMNRRLYIQNNLDRQGNVD